MCLLFHSTRWASHAIADAPGQGGEPCGRPRLEHSHAGGRLSGVLAFPQAPPPPKSLNHVDSWAPDGLSGGAGAPADRCDRSNHLTLLYPLGAPLCRNARRRARLSARPAVKARSLPLLCPFAARPPRRGTPPPFRTRRCRSIFPPRRRRRSAPATTRSSSTGLRS